MWLHRHYSQAFVVIACVVVTLAGCGAPGGQAKGPEEKPHNVRALVLAHPREVRQYIEISGPVSPEQGTDLVAEEAGSVVSIVARKGAAVASGDVLLEQDRVILAADLEAAKADLAVKDFNLDKVQQLFAAGKVSRLELLQAQDEQAQADARFKIAARRHDRAAITAPFAGIVVDRYVELGQYLLPGLKAVRVIDPYSLKLTGYVTADQVGQVTGGEQCPVAIGDSNETVIGSLTFVSSEADLQTGKFKVEVSMANPTLRLKSGVIARAQLPLASVKGVVIPRDAVLDDLSGPAAFVIRDGLASRRRLVLGLDQGLMVAVRSGLVIGDTLVVRGQRELRNGSRVAITEWATADDGTLPGDPLGVRDTEAGGRTPGETGQEPR